jgi:glycosyltransferase involved in cell wall biosynthesis
VFLGAPGLAWAGVDKLARLAAATPDWQFDAIGPGPDEIVDPPPNLRLHGLMNRDAYQPLLAAADVAIGPLALHRKGLSEASALKVAEYLACGLPVVIANRETAFPEGEPFLLRIPNTEDNVETARDAIRGFVDAWSGRRVARADIAAIDTAVVERERLRRIIGEAAP